MIKTIDKFLNKITMYRVVLYCLIFLWIAALFLSFFRLLPYQPFDLAASLVFILAVCYLGNFIFAWVFDAPSNMDSVYITALILALIVSPAKPFGDLAFLGLVSLAAMASKYILAINKKHIFNPAAVAVVLTAFAIHDPAVWWIGTPFMLPFVLIAGFMIVRKIRKFDFVLSFLATALVSALVLSLADGENPAAILQNMLLYSPLFFFGSVMLTEPLTTPPRKGLRIIYGLLTGFLFAPQVHISSIYYTPELALVTANLFSYLVSPKKKLVLTLKNKIRIAPDVYEFLFVKKGNFSFLPGQYLEWTKDHSNPDSRGIRRVFTIASSPKEEEIRIGVKFYNPSSSFKKSLVGIGSGEKIVAGQLAGDFILPSDSRKKLAFIAGGIGITPFRSMIGHLLNTNQKRNVVLLYSNKTESDIVYKNIFDMAKSKLGIKTVHILTGPGSISKNWNGRRGFINAETIKEEIPDYNERLFFVSGPPAMVMASENLLRKMGIPKRHIKKDFFSGF